jgi:hypothetical protein
MDREDIRNNIHVRCSSIDEYREISCIQYYEDIFPVPDEFLNDFMFGVVNWGSTFNVRNNEMIFDFDEEIGNFELKYGLYGRWFSSSHVPLVAGAHLARRFPDAIFRLEGLDNNNKGAVVLVIFELGNFTFHKIVDSTFLSKTDRVYDELLSRFPYFKELVDGWKMYSVEKPILDDNDFVVIYERYLLNDWMKMWYNSMTTSADNLKYVPIEFGGTLGKKGIPVLKIKRIEEVPEDWECGICREGKDERSVFKFRCGGDHIFHSICAKEWGKTKVKRYEQTTCPMCVRVVSSTASQEPESQQTPIGMDIE